MSSRTIIVFGPTGAVGSAVARTAHSHGARVVLAMRDTSKAIPGLSKEEEEQTDRYERVQADLTQPESLGGAVTNTGATYAFIYAALHGTPDFMRSSLAALKAAGIQFVVMLSSSAIQGDAREATPSDFIAFAHAQVEIALEDLFGREGYVAVRPAFFASNAFWWRNQIVESGEVQSAFPDLKVDFLSPEDIGEVAGTILAGGRGEKEGENVVALAGPESMSTYDAVKVIGQVIGKEVRVTKVDREEGLQVMVTKSGIPEPIAKILLEQFLSIPSDDGLLRLPGFEEARANVERYLQRPAMRFSEWVERNKGAFAA